MSHLITLHDFLVIVVANLLGGLVLFCLELVWPEGRGPQDAPPDAWDEAEAAADRLAGAYTAARRDMAVIMRECS